MLLLQKITLLRRMCKIFKHYFLTLKRKKAEEQFGVFTIWQLKKLVRFVFVRIFLRFILMKPTLV